MIPAHWYALLPFLCMGIGLLIGVLYVLLKRKK